MFSSNRVRFFSISTRLLERFKVYPIETSTRQRALVESIAEAENQTAFFAWHPKKDYPYECTRDLPTNIEQKSSSLLRDESIASAQAAWKLKHPIFTRDRLSKLTFTTVHRWFPRSRDKKANYKKTPMDRRYL